MHASKNSTQLLPKHQVSFLNRHALLVLEWPLHSRPDPSLTRLVSILRIKVCVAWGAQEDSPPPDNAHRVFYTISCICSNCSQNLEN